MTPNETDSSSLVRRLGRFSVPESFVRSHPEVIMKVMAECVVIRCELRYDIMTFEYAAISPHFAEVPEYLTPPAYVARIESVRTGTDDDPQYDSIFLGFFPEDEQP